VNFWTFQTNEKDGPLSGRVVFKDAARRGLFWNWGIAVAESVVVSAKNREKNRRERRG
jgi:hypothetical protein